MQLSGLKQVANTDEEKYELGFAYLMNWVSAYMEKLKIVCVCKKGDNGPENQYKIRVDFQGHDCSVFPLYFLDGLNHPAPYPLPSRFSAKSPDFGSETEAVPIDDSERHDKYLEANKKLLAETQVIFEQNKLKAMKTYQFLQSSELTEFIKNTFKKYEVEHEHSVYDFAKKHPEFNLGKSKELELLTSMFGFAPFQDSRFEHQRYVYDSFEEFFEGIIGFVNNAMMLINIKSNNDQPAYAQSLIHSFHPYRYDPKAMRKAGMKLKNDQPEYEPLLIKGFKPYCFGNYSNILRVLYDEAKLPLYKLDQNITPGDASVADSNVTLSDASVVASNIVSDDAIQSKMVVVSSVQQQGASETVAHK